MSYVSSAGLRVLLIMYKSLQDKSRFKMLFMTRHAKCVFRLAADKARSGGRAACPMASAWARAPLRRDYLLIG